MLTTVETPLTFSGVHPWMDPDWTEQWGLRWVLRIEATLEAEATSVPPGWARLPQLRTRAAL